MIISASAGSDPAAISGHIPKPFPQDLVEINKCHTIGLLQSSPTGKRHIGQVSHPLEFPVITDQYLCTPYRPVGSPSGAVTYQPDGLA